MNSYFQMNPSKIILMDMDTYEKKRSKKDKIYYGFEGLYVTIFKKQNEVYRTWEKYSNILDDEYLKGKYFECGGLTNEQLYDGNNDDTVYEFLLVTPELFLYSKHDFTKGFLICLNVKGSTNIQMIVDNQLIGQKTGIYKLLPISRQESIKYLQYGFHCQSTIESTDIELYPGEFIFIKSQAQLYQVESKSYLYRKKISGKATNYMERFYQLTDLAFISYRDSKKYQEHQKTAYHQFFKNLLPIDIKEISQVIYTSYIISWNSVSADDTLLTSQKDRIYNIWLNLLSSVPLQQQQRIYNLFTRYYMDRYRLISWISDYLTSTISFEPSPQLASFLNNFPHKDKDKKTIHKYLADRLTCTSGKIIYNLLSDCYTFYDVTFIY